MKAIVYTKFGPPEVLQLTDIEKPEPNDTEVLIKVHATTVTAGDWRVRSLTLPRGFGFLGRLVFGISKPRQPILGTELAGVIEAIGNNVKQFKVGDRVFAFTGAKMGCYVEYKTMVENGPLVHMPDNLSFEEAAALSFGGTTGLHFFRQGNLQKGETVLINGASGGVGTAMVQLAKHFGATVTAVCSSANCELVKSLGADYIIDYTKEDFTQNGRQYDIIVDTVGNASFSRSSGSLKPNGRLLLVSGTLADIFKALWVSKTSDKKMLAGPASENIEDLRTLATLAAMGKFKPFIDKKYPLENIVEAHRYVDMGHKRGNVVITLDLQ
ncbi:MAG: NAD(P)-dependent alcohol dehydrogenase [bacterium]|nr:NAD(P)-dependent alcohol dehydrogenase [bacterium]